MYYDHANYYYQLVKGRIAENITEEMFNLLGITIESFGVENRLPNVTKFLRKFKDTTTVRHLRYMPDFVFFRDDSEPKFLEVKYRTNGELTNGDLHQYKEYPNILFLVFDLDNIYSLYPDYSSVNYADDEAKRIKPEIVFKDDPNFNFSDADKLTIDGFVEVAKAFYSNLNIKL